MGSDSSHWLEEMTDQPETPANMPEAHRMAIIDRLRQLVIEKPQTELVSPEAKPQTD